MKISYAIPVCNEHEELKRLLEFLVQNIEKNDEIVVQCDQGNTTSEVYKVLNLFQAPVGLKGPIKVIEFPLKGDFSSFKNNLKENCSGDWIFQIDADELPHESLTVNLKELLKVNPTTDLFLIPRVNTVDGLTQGHINQWRWNVNEKGWVNWPDYQTRIVQNNPKIKWINKVHEVLVGHENYALLPQEEEWCLYHPKHIKRQEAQNNFYNTL
jgi:glycosyltransferase involved in cell wall biosynthesis|tara:strand:+ start:1571 stop:2206 length:636 start_codon:yes stop_codon:yes gene_type:complete